MLDGNFSFKNDDIIINNFLHLDLDLKQLFWSFSFERRFKYHIPEGGLWIPTDMDSKVGYFQTTSENSVPLKKLFEKQNPKRTWTAHNLSHTR